MVLSGLEISISIRLCCTRNLKQALNHGLVLKKVHGVVKFNQEAWLKLYIDVNTELTKNAKK